MCYITRVTSHKRSAKQIFCGLDLLIFLLYVGTGEMGRIKKSAIYEHKGSSSIGKFENLKN